MNISEQAWQIPVNDPPVGRDNLHICYPNVNTCLTMTFCFDNFMVGIHLGQTMGAPRNDFLQHADLTRYMQAVKQHIGPRPTPNCTNIFVLGALDAWAAHTQRNNIIDGLNRWSNELTGNPVPEYRQWDDSVHGTVNIHVNLNRPAPCTYSFYQANNTLAPSGAVSIVNDGTPVNSTQSLHF